jgi:hypothetical protein
MMAITILYVGVLKEILELDYGPVSTPIILFRCDWVQNGLDYKGNPTYKQDEAHVAER